MEKSSDGEKDEADAPELAERPAPKEKTNAVKAQGSGSKGKIKMEEYIEEAPLKRPRAATASAKKKANVEKSRGVEKCIE